MGDDLIFAQKFTRTAADGLALLVEMEDPRAAHEASVVIDMMTTVQRGAKRLRARHIYSGAQGVLSALHHETDATLNGRIENLGSVVTHYARGLNELLEAQNTVPEKTPLDKWDAARETLNAMLPIASSEDADMLSRLMRAPVTLETVQPDHEPLALEADIVPFTKSSTSKTEVTKITETSVVEDIDLVDTSLVHETAPSIEKSTPTATAKDNGPSVTLDAVMRDVIADALSVARTVGRTISLSYDMGDKTVSEDRGNDLRARLGQTLSQIIRQSLTEGRVGHIDINLAGKQLHIMAGTTAIRVALDPVVAPKVKPRITDETEQGLRKQLHALMDPISLHETAS